MSPHFVNTAATFLGLKILYISLTRGNKTSPLKTWGHSLLYKNPAFFSVLSFFQCCGRFSKPFFILWSPHLLLLFSLSLCEQKPRPPFCRSPTPFKDFSPTFFAGRSSSCETGFGAAVPCRNGKKRDFLGTLPAVNISAECQLSADKMGA